MVPIKLDALLLIHDQAVIGTKADFSKLPYFDGVRDINSDTANIVENIASQPLEPPSLILKSGIHLHWSLPDALTRGAQSDAGTDFPSVPNRWLVVRTETVASPQRQAAWVVESDYLYPDGATGLQGGVSVPVSPDPANKRFRPYRYMGRRTPLSSWTANDPNAQYVDKLTAVGYGEPAFAAFYPNCLTVFGFHDDEVGGSSTGLQYDVYGWYSDPNADPVAAFSKNASGASAETLVQTLADRYQWTVSLAGQDFPQSMICYARLTFQPTTPASGPLRMPTRVTVANTGTEALSAFLADYLVQQKAIDASQKGILEEQLEALQLASRLANRQLDLGPKFVEARHEKGFVAVRAGWLWIVRPNTSGAADADRGQAQQQVTLPAGLAQALDALNARQLAYDAALEQIRSMQRQLFADWYKYMISAYPPDDARDDYPEVDLIRYFIQRKDLAPLQDKVPATGALRLALDGAGNVTAASDTSGDTLSLAANVAQGIQTVLQMLTALNNSAEAKAANTVHGLRQMAAPRYWAPREPVVLIAGAAAKPTDRHGRDGMLACQVLPNTASVSSLLPNNVETLTAQVTAIGKSTGIDIWTQPPWEPFLLEWEVEVLPMALGSNLDAESGIYSPDFITDTYSLGLNQPDLTVVPGRGALRPGANLYRGSSILTPQAQMLVSGLIDGYLNDPDVDQNSDLYKRLQAVKQVLSDPSFYSLSQSLGGFNEALLNRKQALQLPVADPLGFSDYQRFTTDVASAVGDQNRSSPQPLWDFNPIRSGVMRLVQLRLIDNFGQFRDLDVSQIITSEAQRVSGDNTLIALPPRLVQPSRLNFRWLSAAGDDMEMNDDPATTPICGWLLPNNFDGSLMIYDNAGAALGMFDRAGAWRGLAGAPAVSIASIVNPRLRGMVGFCKGSRFAFSRTSCRLSIRRWHISHPRTSHSTRTWLFSWAVP